MPYNHAKKSLKAPDVHFLVLPVSFVSASFGAVLF